MPEHIHREKLWEQCNKPLFVGTTYYKQKSISKFNFILHSGHTPDKSA